jgi:hypothetical protein
VADEHHADVEIAVAGVRRRRTRQKPEVPKRGDQPASACIARISRLMALAIKFDQMIARGEVRDYADLAQLEYVTRARMTQIMNLLHLAPDLQEKILFLSSTSSRSPIAERQLRGITAEVDWEQQRTHWHRNTEKRALKRGGPRELNDK